MSTNTETFNLDSLLDGTLDALADMPEFKPFPPGTHAIFATIVDKASDKKKWVNGHPAYELKMIAEETLELADSSSIPLVKGAETSVLYMLDNEMGQGGFKKILAAGVEKFGPKTNREIIGEFNNLSCTVVTSLRNNKDKTQQYTGIVELLVM